MKTLAQLSILNRITHALSALLVTTLLVNSVYGLAGSDLKQQARPQSAENTVSVRA